MSFCRSCCFRSRAPATPMLAARSARFCRQRLCKPSLAQRAAIFFQTNLQSRSTSGLGPKALRPTLITIRRKTFICLCLARKHLSWRHPVFIRPCGCTRPSTGTTDRRRFPISMTRVRRWSLSCRLVRCFTFPHFGFIMSSLRCDKRLAGRGEPSISINFWSESQAYNIMEQAFTSPVPLDEDMSTSTMCLRVRLFIRTLLFRLGGVMLAATLPGAVFEQRYGLLRGTSLPATPCPSLPSVRAWPEERDPDKLKLESDSMKPHLLRLVGLFQQLQGDVRDLYLANFIEHLLFRVFGLDAVPSLLLYSLWFQPFHDRKYFV
eukprot:m.275651 g.275651  ORF g.275651 m.275651 type:complete len:320 (-) comp19356_c1_seq9:3517-4476(-)